jgi:hypothetical protein
MRFLIHILFFSFIINNGFAQTGVPAKDTIKTNKVNYSEIVKVDSTNRFDLYKKASKWVAQNKFEVIEEDPLGGKILAKTNFIVYSEKGVLAKPNGDFTYDIIIDLKEGKYRYSFTNFIFRRYKQDRQDLLKYIPEKSRKPIEDTKAPGWKKQWSRDKLQVNNRVNEHIASLREAMKYIAPKPIEAPKPKEEW